VDGTVFLAAKRLRRVIVHGDHFARRYNFNFQPATIVLRQFWLDCLWLANQHYTYVQLACSQHTSFNFGTGRIVPSHRIHGNCDHWGLTACNFLDRLSGNLFDRFTFIVAAAWASLMRLLHFMTMRAFRERGLRQVIVCPASAGAALGMASFWIRHRTTPLFSIPAPPFRIFRPGRNDPVFSCTPFSGVLGREARISAQNSFSSNR